MTSFCAHSHPLSATAPDLRFELHNAFQMSSYAMIYPRLRTRQLSGSGGRGSGLVAADIHRGAGGKADVKRCRSRLMGTGGERKSLIYSGGLPG